MREEQVIYTTLIRDNLDLLPLLIHFIRKRDYTEIRIKKVKL